MKHVTSHWSCLKRAIHKNRFGMARVKFVKRRCDVDGKLNDIRDRLDQYRYDSAVEMGNSPKTDNDELSAPLALAKKNIIIEAVRGPAWKDRKKLEQYGPNCSRFGIERPRSTATRRNPVFLLGIDNYGFREDFAKRPRPRKGYQTLAAVGKRWNEYTKANMVPSLLPFAKDPTIIRKVPQYPKQSPFNTSGERFPDRSTKPSENETPGPAFYDITKVAIGRRVTAQHKLGHGAVLPPPFHIHCSQKQDERCNMCKTEVWCLPSYYTIPGRKVFLCPLCYFVERKMAITQTPLAIAKFKRVIDCSTIHTHFPDSDRVLTHATLQEVKWLAQKEHYMHLHYPKQRDSLPAPGVTRYAAP